MKKLLWVIFLLLVCVISFYIFSKKNVKLQGLSGEIVLANPNMEKNNGRGIVIYNLVNGTEKLVWDTGKYISINSQDSKSKVLLVDRENEIFEGNIYNNESITYLFSSIGRDFAYMPNQEKISFINNNRITIYEKKHKNFTNIMLTERLSGYSWAKDGKSLVYSNGKTIYQYSLNEKEKTPLVRGINPLYSSDNKYLLYSQDLTTLVVLELQTGKEWTYSGNHIYPQFSPDEKFIAFQVQSKKAFSKGRDLVIWDYQADKMQTIIEDIDLDTSGQFVWRNVVE